MNLVTRGLGSGHDNLPTFGLGHSVPFVAPIGDEKTRPYGGREDKLFEQQLREDEELMVIIHAFMQSIDD